MMRKTRKFSYQIIFGVLLVAVSNISSATCNVVTTPIRNILTYNDGSVFVYTEKDNNCGCSNPNQLIFNAVNDPMGKTWYATVIVAKSLGKTISAFGESGVCVGAGEKIWALNSD